MKSFILNKLLMESMKRVKSKINMIHKRFYMEKKSDINLPIYPKLKQKGMCTETGLHLVYTHVLPSSYILMIHLRTFNSRYRIYFATFIIDVRAKLLIS